MPSNVSDWAAAPALFERAGGMRYLLGDKGCDADRCGVRCAKQTPLWSPRMDEAASAQSALTSNDFATATSSKMPSALLRTSALSPPVARNLPPTSYRVSRSPSLLPSAGCVWASGASLMESDGLRAITFGPLAARAQQRVFLGIEGEPLYVRHYRHRGQRTGFEPADRQAPADGVSRSRQCRLCAISAGNLVLRHTQGKPVSLVVELANRPAPGSIGIVHTRWVTQTEDDAHPHTTEHAALVHDCIIEYLR